MAARGTKKARSVAQEDMIAGLYNGVRSPSSGAADTDQGDVRTDYELIEAKYTGGPGEKIKRPKLLSDMEKVAMEAWTEGREPVVAMRYYDPESPLANKQGYIDMTVRLMHEDAARSDKIRLLGSLLKEQVLNGRS